MERGAGNNLFACLLMYLTVPSISADLLARRQFWGLPTKGANDLEDFLDMSIKELMEFPVFISASRQEKKIAAPGFTRVTMHDTPGRTFFVRLQSKF